ETCFNGSTVGGPWLTWVGVHILEGPVELQWVHGRGTVVNASTTSRTTGWTSCFNGSTVGGPWLTAAIADELAHRCSASMGPRSGEGLPFLGARLSLGCAGKTA